MPLVTSNTSIKLGYEMGYGQGGGVAIDSPSAGCALPFLADFTGNITRVILYTIAISTFVFDPTRTPPYYYVDNISTDITNLNVGIMQSNATGDLPSDIFLATPNTISLIASPPPIYYTINLDNAIPVIKGNIYWLVYKPNASFTGKLVLNTGTRGYDSPAAYRISTRSGSTWSRTGGIGHLIYGSSTRWYSNDIPILPVARTYNLEVNKEYGLAFKLKAKHPAIRVRSIQFQSLGNDISSFSNLTLICNIRSETGVLLYTFDTHKATNTKFGNNYFFIGRDIWLEANTKYYIMLAFSGTFTTAVTYRNFTYNQEWNDIDGSFTANYAERLSDGTIIETLDRYTIFQITIDQLRFDDTQPDVYINSSPMFSGGFSG